MNLAKANEARLESQLSKLIRSSDFGVVTYRQYVQKHLENGGRLEAVPVRDDAALRKAQKEYEAMRNSRDWVPTGNPNHPRTIQYNKLRQQIENPPTKLEYRLWKSDDVFTELPKLVFDWASAEGAN